MRIASLVGKTVSGDFINLGIADAIGIDALVGKYNGIVAAGGKLGSGKKDVALVEMYLLANNTSGGELKARRRFTPIAG